MKRLFIMMTALWCALSAATAAETAPAKAPENVKKCFADIEQQYGLPSSVVVNTKKNPDSGQLEMSVRTVEFRCAVDAEILNTVKKAFTDDEPCGYQMVHIMPGEDYRFSIPIPEDAMLEVKARTNNEQEFMLLNVKNADNPKLRDCYAIAWQADKNGKNMVTGKLFIVTSKRPEAINGNNAQTDNTASDKERILNSKLEAYQNMLNTIESQIFELNNIIKQEGDKDAVKRRAELYRQMELIMAQMTDIINNHAENK